MKASDGFKIFGLVCVVVGGCALIGEGLKGIDEAAIARRAACFDIGIDHGRFLQSVDIARARGETLPRWPSVKRPTDCGGGSGLSASPAPSAPVLVPMTINPGIVGTATTIMCPLQSAASTGTLASCGTLPAGRIVAIPALVGSVGAPIPKPNPLRKP